MKQFCKRTLSALLAISVLSGTIALLCSCKKGNTSPETTKQWQTSASTSENTLPPDSVGDVTPPEKIEKDPALEITELMVRNEVGTPAPNGERYPWIEFRALKAAELSNYSIKIGDSKAMQLPAKSLKEGELYVLYLGMNGFSLALPESALINLMHGELVSQSFVYINRSRNCSYIVSTSSESTRPTPGYKNALESDRLVISELMCDNTLYPVDGVIGDFIEIYNAGESDIKLSNYFISDKPADPYLCPLPDITLKAGEYTVLRADRELNFGLSQSGETVCLTRNDGVVSSMASYTFLDKNVCYTPEGISTIPTPGYPNTEEGYNEYISSRQGLVISEVITSNTRYKKYQSDYHDMVELYNNSGEDIRLSDYYLTDKAKDLQKYKLPDVILKSGSYYIVYCTGKGGNDPSFSLSSDGENLLLTRQDGYVCDSIKIPKLPVDVSYGRYDGKLVYMELPSFGATNSRGYSSVSRSPVATVESGSYTGKVTLHLMGEGDIYYTTDGTKPTVSSKKYAGEEISFEKSGSLRMIAKEGELISSFERSYTYFVDIPDYTLPKMMVATSNEDMFGEGGLYPSSAKKLENEARVSLYDAEGNEEFSVSCGIKLFGGTSIKYDKKSFQLKFRAQYGTGKLKYKVFDDLDIDEFNALVLRAGAQSQFRTMMTDELGTSLASTSGNMPSVLVQAYRPVNLYINEQYMGLYYIREKVGDDFVASHLGGEPEDCTLMGFWDGTYALKGKDAQEWKDIYSFVQKQDLRIKENYEHVKSVIDIDSVIDFYIMEMFVNNTDSGNVKVAKSRSGDGKWRYILYDLDLSFTGENSGANNYLGEHRPTKRPFNSVIYNLLKNDEFYAYFNERLEMHFATTLSPETVLARIEAIKGEISHDMQYEIERWKHVTEPMVRPKTIAAWEKQFVNCYYKASEEFLDKMRSQLNTAIAKIR